MEGRTASLRAQKEGAHEPLFGQLLFGALGGFMDGVCVSTHISTDRRFG